MDAEDRLLLGMLAFFAALMLALGMWLGSLFSPPRTPPARTMPGSLKTIYGTHGELQRC